MVCVGACEEEAYGDPTRNYTYRQHPWRARWQAAHQGAPYRCASYCLVVFPGESAVELARDYHISLADVYAALAYYYNHKDQIDRELAEEDVEHARRAAGDTAPIAQRMREAIAEL